MDLITQNFDSTWRFIDSDDYYDWFGGLYNAARTLGAKPDTSFVDIRNQNNYVSRSYAEELDYEIDDLKQENYHLVYENNNLINENERLGMMNSEIWELFIADKNIDKGGETNE